VTDEAHVLPTDVKAEASMGIHESASDAGCFTFIGESVVVDDQIDPGLLRDIRNSVPRFVPLITRRRYRTPANTEITVPYHVIGMYIPDPADEFVADYIRIDRYPRNFPFDPRKIQTLRTLWKQWPKETTEYALCAPPAPVEFGPWVADSMKNLKKAMEGVIGFDSETGRTHQITTTRDTLNEILHAESERDKRIEKQAMQEARYRMRHNWRWFKEAADNERFVPEPPDDASKKVILDLKG
jgi:hypothetical protein